MLKKLIPALCILSFTACAPAPKTDDVMEPAPAVEVPAGDQAMATETITFVGKSSIVDHPGHFMKFTIATTPAAAFEETSITATIDLTSVMTDSQGLDGHLQREDFFNTAVY
ncbi:YceI family protein, partial [Candidatus Peregrinibacteria bacterium]|nr:YceI family protein [Candidatus Peregrinibacteria bacterium]